MALKEKTNSLRSHMLGDWEWYRGIPEEENFGSLARTEIKDSIACG